MFLKHIDLTTALRPSYLPDEVLLFVQDNVGLYEGKFGLPNQQNGQVYLTSHRICYVDKKEPRANSVALDLKEVDRFEFYAGFLKSSPKITIVPKPLRLSSLHSRAIAHAASPSRTDAFSPTRRDSASRPPSEPPPLTTAHWVCTICSFSNPIPVNFDPAAANAHTPLPPCLACGIKPTLSHVLKAAISNASNRPLAAPGAPNVPSLAVRPKAPDSAFHTSRLGDSNQARDGLDPKTDPTASFQCPRCTFSNHPSLLSCEICGASLLSQSIPSMAPDVSDAIRMRSPGPLMDYKARAGPGGVDISDSVKVSFRGGGEKIFHERLKGAMTQRKWLLHNAPPAPNSSRMMDDGSANGPPDGSSGSRTKTAGIAGLEQLGLNMRKNNELLIGSAFEDLEALMSSAKEVIALAERFARQNRGANGVSAEENAILAESASQLGMVTTKDIVGGGSSESLYLSELSRNMAEFLADDARGVLKKAGGILTLVDLWAMFNRARGGVELVSPMDFEKAARLWESLKLPVRLRTFRSGVMVVQGRDCTDETTIKSLLSWLQDLHEFPPDRDVAWDWREFGRGVTAQEAAERFGWSIGVAEEELLMAEEHGALCREEGLEGLKFWQNYIDTGDIPPPKSQLQLEEEAISRALRANGII
ncbi:Vacuolar protein-sorting-associated protein 36 [Tolypocladium capitatum]|uniref:Vacuolar protein-sorting-associated protein 36 n=1 Tax=Tolypocladium capitatum TaxID=45235 RepID=A0A2K3QCL4_9HYPO|nr:Vacuolar protein-sorting-associated protein 36 [Tolypocladium capitatum]